MACQRNSLFPAFLHAEISGFLKFKCAQDFHTQRLDQTMTCFMVWARGSEEGDAIEPMRAPQGRYHGQTRVNQTKKKPRIPKERQRPGQNRCIEKDRLTTRRRKCHPLLKHSGSNKFKKSLSFSIRFCNICKSHKTSNPHPKNNPNVLVHSHKKTDSGYQIKYHPPPIERK